MGSNDQKPNGDKKPEQPKQNQGNQKPAEQKKPDAAPAEKAPEQTGKPSEDQISGAPSEPTKAEDAAPASDAAEAPVIEETPATDEGADAADLDVGTDAVDEAPADTAPAGSTVSTQIGMNATVKNGDQHIIDVIKARLDEYAATMAVAKPITPVEGGRQQQTLYRTIEMALKLEGTAFTKGWSTVLGFAADHRKGVFSEKYIMRFFEHAKLDGAQIRIFQNLLNLIMATAVPAGRQLGLKHVSLASTVDGILIPNVNDKLVGYYHM